MRVKVFCLQTPMGGDIVRSMGREIVYCEKCGARILQEEFDRGQAIIVQNKNYCPRCRQGVSPPAPPPPPPAPAVDPRPVPADRAKGSSALRRAVKAPLSRPSLLRSGHSGSRHPSVGRPPAGPRGSPRGAALASAAGRGGAGRGGAERVPRADSSNKTMMIVIAVVIGVVLLLAFMMSGSDAPSVRRRQGGSGGEEHVERPPSRDPQEALSRLQADVQRLLQAGQAREARQAVQAYQDRFPQANPAAVRKLVEQINWKE